MATRYIDKVTTATTANARNLPDATGIVYETSTGALKYNNAGTIVPVGSLGANYRQEQIYAYAVSGDALHAANLTAFTAPAAGIITRAVLNITTASTGASTIDVGVTATTATTSSDTLLDGVSGTPAAVFDSADAGLDTGANDMAQAIASGSWVTMDEASGDTTGLVGTLFIWFVPNAIL